MLLVQVKLSGEVLAQLGAKVIAGVDGGEVSQDLTGVDGAELLGVAQ